MGEMLRQAQQMQAKMQALREELRQRQVQGTAGGGMVTVTLNGANEPLRIEISRDPSDPERKRLDPNLIDAEMLEDLVLTALADAQQKLQALVQQEMGNLAGPIAGAFGLPGA